MNLPEMGHITQMCTLTYTKKKFKLYIEPEKKLIFN